MARVLRWCGLVWSPQLLRLLKLPRLFRLIRIWRLFKMMKLNDAHAEFMQYLTYSRHANIVRLVRLLLVIVVLVHYLACVFFVVALQGKWMDLQECRYRNEASQFVLLPCSEAPPLTQYITAYYTSMLLLSGEDIFPKATTNGDAGVGWGWFVWWFRFDVRSQDQSAALSRCRARSISSGTARRA